MRWTNLDYRLTLSNTTGAPETDALVRSVVGTLEEAFPGRILGYYVQGSYADRTDVPASDLDLTIVFADQISDVERARMSELVTGLEGAAMVELDLQVTDERALERGIEPSLKLASRLIHGQDVRDRFALMPIDAWSRDRMHTSYWRIASLFGRPRVVAVPQGYPDPAGEFYGYNRRTIRRPDGSEVSSTRDLIRMTGWAATGLIALKAGRYVARKSECHVLYRECIGDEWASLFEDVYEHCRTRWHYLIPSESADRARLREICERTLAFENYFLTAYKVFLISELRSEAPGARLEALRPLGHAPFLDDDVRDVLQTPREVDDEDVRHAAEAALLRYPSR
ncbi:MAG: hypothetical protein ACRDIY_02340 [Chloroflexota bacterium]